MMSIKKNLFVFSGLFLSLERKVHPLLRFAPFSLHFALCTKKKPRHVPDGAIL